MLESCMTPDLAVEITMQPVRRYGVDAAIFFSDIVLPLKAVGVDLDIKPGVGPVVASPVRTLEDVAAIPDLTPEHVPFITESVRRLVVELGPTPLIGFAGAPFTVASYLVEGGPSKEHAKTKAMMFGAPEVWAALMDKIAGIASAYLAVQVAAGASAVQLFDSWAGACTPEDYATYVMPYSARVLAAAGELGVPRIHFGVGTGELLGLMGEAGADVVGVDWRVPLAEGVRRAGGRAVQGNLDPSLVFAPTEMMLARATEVVEAGRAAPGHIFNLGHGVLPSTDPDQLARLTDHVHSLR
jgi:uroporphyrinogen decarboxylase